MKLLILNGPNLNLLGKREPGIYGSQTFEEFYYSIKSNYNNCEIDYYQSNHEGDIVTKVQDADDIYDGVILNAGAYTHTSVAIGDAIKAVSVPVVEVHISNTFAREAFRHQSYITPNAKGLILGFGMDVYKLAIQSFLN